MLSLDPKTGLLLPVTFGASPNFNERPEVGGEISLLVIHNISLPAGQFGTPYIAALFANKLPDYLKPTSPFYPADENYRLALMEVADLQVSSHLLINRAGEITQYVPFTKRAWHAGISEFQERANCNDFSIGIELEGTDTEPYMPAQYQSLLAVTALLMKHYPLITQDRIVGHSDIAPGRKTDPGSAFDWLYFRLNLPKG